MEDINQEVSRKLNQIQIDINFIKGNMIDSDVVLTSEEKEGLDTAMDEYRRGEVVILEEIEVARKNAGLEIQ